MRVYLSQLMMEGAPIAWAAPLLPPADTRRGRRIAAGARSYRPVGWMLLFALLELVPAVLLSSPLGGTTAATTALLTLGALGISASRKPSVSS